MFVDYLSTLIDRRDIFMKPPMGALSSAIQNVPWQTGRLPHGSLTAAAPPRRRRRPPGASHLLASQRRAMAGTSSQSATIFGARVLTAALSFTSTAFGFLTKLTKLTRLPLKIMIFDRQYGP